MESFPEGHDTVKQKEKEAGESRKRELRPQTASHGAQLHVPGTCDRFVFFNIPFGVFCLFVTYSHRPRFVCYFEPKQKPKVWRRLNGHTVWTTDFDILICNKLM